MRIVLNFCLTLSLSSLAHANLPESLDAHILESMDTVPFHGDPRAALSPIGMKLLINGKPALTREAIDEAFIDLFFARVPKEGPQILSSKNTRGQEIWKYPAGTQTFHVIKLRTDGEPLFELRTALLRSDGTWDLGVYLQESSALRPQLRRQNDSSMPATELKFKSSQSGRELHVTLNRLPLHNCKTCHFNISPSRYQFASPEDAGPCGFGPAHPTLMRDWSIEYEKRVGRSPIENQ
jgi:hypothetical protein